MKLALTKITRHPALLLRRRLDTEMVRHYADRMRAGDSFPPVDVVKTESGEYLLADGHHRFAAAEARGEVVISANVTTGTLRDAMVIAVRANDRNGMRLTPAEQKRAILESLKADVEADRLVEAGLAEDAVQAVQLELLGGAEKSGAKKRKTPLQRAVAEAESALYGAEYAIELAWKADQTVSDEVKAAVVTWQQFIKQLKDAAQC